LSAFKNNLKNPDDDSDLITKLFTIELENTVKNKENPDEEPVVSHESVAKLSCHIDN
jgi:hypothetical protein